jgi:hypothetical protein
LDEEEDDGLTPIQAQGKLVPDYSLVELAASAGAPRCVRFLIEFLRCRATEVALQLAVRRGHLELIRDLMNRVECSGPVLETVILQCTRAAIEHCHGSVLGWSLRDADSSALIQAATIAMAWRKASPTRQLSKLGTDFHKIAATAGWPSLYRAVGASISVTPSSYSSLMHAVIRGATEVVLDLLGKGANVNEHGPNGFTPLHFAVQIADVQAPDEHGADQFVAGDRSAILGLLLRRSLSLARTRSWRTSFQGLRFILLRRSETRVLQKC